jgi:hypothetical protein
MKQTCPKCYHEFEVETQQSRAARAKWTKFTPDEIRAEMSRRRALGIKRAKRAARNSL